MWKVSGFFFIVAFSLLLVADDPGLDTPTPRLSIIQQTIDDSSGGNNNGVLEPGETATIQVDVYNAGTATAWNLVGSLS